MAFDRKEDGAGTLSKRTGNRHLGNGVETVCSVGMWSSEDRKCMMVMMTMMTMTKTI